MIRSRAVPSRRRRDGLIRHAHDVHSQNGEDGILARLFALLPSACGEERWCVDVGAWDGRHLSNTYQLLFGVASGVSSSKAQERWRGILIEADAERFRQLQDLHRETNNLCLNVTVTGNSFDDPHNLHRILKEHAADVLPVNFDFLCVDIDGADYWVLHDLWLAAHYKPSVVCIEFNPTMPDSLIYIPPRNDEHRHGASLAALVALAEANDYVLVETTLYNAFLVQRSLYQEYLSAEVPDTSIEALHETTMGTSLYQLYDGTLKLWGCKRMLWHRMPMNERKMQMLPENERIFPFAPTAKDDEAPFDMSLVVDLSPYDSRENGAASGTTMEQQERRQQCAAKLVRQLQKDGFGLVRGTGMDASTCRAALDATHSLLQQADESVRRSCLARDRARRGYAPMNVENFASLLGEHGPNDLVRKFRMGPVTAQRDDGCGSSLLQPNIWPTAESWDEASASSFRSTVEKYYEAACRAAQTLVQAICDGLLIEHPELKSALQPLHTSYHDDDDDDDSDSADQMTSILTLLAYRTGTRHKGNNKGPLVAAHTDVGLVTVLLFEGKNTCASLQRRDDDEGWVDVQLPGAVPQDPIFVVHVADCFSELTRGKLKSTVHRVVARRDSKVPRNCCALFVGLDPACPLQIGDKRMSYEAWRKRRIAQSQEVLKAAAR